MSDPSTFRHGELVALVKWWHDGDTVPDGWTPMGPFNRGEALENARLRAAFQKIVDGPPCPYGYGGGEWVTELAERALRGLPP